MPTLIMAFVNKKMNHKYQITIAWSTKDNCYLAYLPDFALFFVLTKLYKIQKRMIQITINICRARHTPPYLQSNLFVANYPYFLF